MKRQLIALMMVIVMVASVCAVAATTVAAATPTSFSITTSKTTPAVDEAFTITGQLKAGTTLLANKPVHLESHKKNSDGTWTDWKNLADAYKRTDSAGKVSSTRTLTTPGAREYRWHYNGSATYATARSSALTVTARQGVASSLTFDKPPLTLHVNQLTGLDGYLKDDAGRGVPTKPIALYARASGQPFSLYGTVTTDANGRWHAQYQSPGAGVVYFYAKYGGDAGYKPSQSRQWGIAVDKPVPVGISLQMPATAAVNQNFAISGQLTDMNGQPVVGVPIKLEYRMGSSGSFSYYGTVNTDSIGTYRAIGGSNAPTTFYIRASFAGDSVYGANAGISGHTTIS